MKIALVAATRFEIEPLREYLTERLYLKAHHRISCVLTGIGLVNTTYALTRHIYNDRPDIAIQAGIAGSFSPLFPPGTVVTIKDEVIADLGVMEKELWTDVYDLGLADPDHAPYLRKKLINPHHTLLERLQVCQVSAISVNEITTSAKRIESYISKYSPVVESMEGAAFHKVCIEEEIPFIQIRGISNMAGERNKNLWNMPEAIRLLNEQIILLINKIAEPHQI